MKTLKQILAKNRKVNPELLEESLKLSRKLAKHGIRGKRVYSLPSPFDKRMVKTTVAELLASRDA